MQSIRDFKSTDQIQCILKVIHKLFLYSPTHAICIQRLACDVEQSMFANVNLIVLLMFAIGFGGRHIFFLFYSFVVMPLGDWLISRAHTNPTDWLMPYQIQFTQPEISGS